MFHLTDDELYSLAEKTEEMQFYSAIELEQMEHLKKCRECYDRFCCVLAMTEITSDTGYMALSDLYNALKIMPLKKTLSTKVLAKVQVVHKKVGESLNIVMEQIDQLESVFQFVPVPMLMNRGCEDGSSTFYKIEEIGDEKTFVLYDAECSELLVQMSKKNWNVMEIKAYITFDNNKKVEIPLIEKGNFFKGILSNISEDSFQIYIEAYTI